MNIKWSFEPRWSILARHLRSHPAPRYLYECRIFDVIGWIGCGAMLKLVEGDEIGWCMAVQTVTASCAAISGWIVLCDLVQEWRTRREINLRSLLSAALTPFIVAWIVGAYYFVPWLRSLLAWGG